MLEIREEVSVLKGKKGKREPYQWENQEGIGRTKTLTLGVFHQIRRF